MSESFLFNSQESIIEIVVEKILGYDNAIDEQQDYEREDHSNNNNLKTNLFFYTTKNVNPHSPFSEKKQSQFYYNTHLLEGFYRHNTPPPKV